MAPEVSIIIVNYNTFELTCNCIQSVIAHTNCKYEIILVDNASQEFDAVEFVKRFPQVKLIQSPVNVGFAKGNNLGIQEASGNYLLLLNSDTVLLNSAVDICLERIKKDVNVGALSCQLVSADGTLQSASNEFVTIRKNLARAFRLQKLFQKFDFKFIDLKSEHATDWIWGTFFLFPTNVLNKLPGHKLPDNFFMYGEDKQWCYKLRNLGYTILYYPEAKIKHFIGASSADKENDRFTKYFLPNEYTMYKLERGRVYAVCLMLSSAFLYMSSFKPSVIKKGFLYIKCAFKGLLGLM